MPSYNTYHLTWVSLTLGVGSLHSCSSKAQPMLLTLDEAYLLTAALPDLQREIDLLGPPVPVQPLLLGRGIGPPCRCPWPRARGGFSQPPLTSEAGCLLPAATDLRRGVAPLGCHP